MGILTELIMHNCIVTLLKHADDESFECLCGLLKTIGKDIDTLKAKVSLLIVFVISFLLFSLGNYFMKNYEILKKFTKICHKYDARLIIS